MSTVKAIKSAQTLNRLFVYIYQYIQIVKYLVDKDLKMVYIEAVEISVQKGVAE